MSAAAQMHTARARLRALSRYRPPDDPELVAARTELDRICRAERLARSLSEMDSLPDPGREDVLMRVAASRAAQGLPPVVADLVILERVAAIMRLDEGESITTDADTSRPRPSRRHGGRNRRPTST